MVVLTRAVELEHSSNFEWLEPKTFGWWSRSLNLGFLFQRRSFWGNLVMQINAMVFSF